MTTTNYAWDPLNDSYLMETDEVGATTAVYTQEPARYGGLVSQRQAGVTSCFHQDNLGSTRLLTDEDGEQIDTFVYDAWGQEVDRTGTTETSLRWVGEKGYYLDPELERYYVRARDFSRRSSAWTTMDRHLFVDGPSRFGYCRQRPTVLIDPAGFQGCHRTGAGVQYVSGRGIFKEAEVAEYVPLEKENITRIGSSARFTWAWEGAKNSFKQQSNCCCTKIGFLQIRRYEAIWRLGVDSKPWAIDGTIPYIVPSGTSECTANPCLRFPDPGTIGRIGLPDNPNAPNVFGVLRSIVHTFETCVVCLEGIEGIVRTGTVFPPAGPGGAAVVTLRNSGMTVYGCYKWGYSVELDPTTSKFKYYRWVDTGDTYWSAQGGTTAKVDVPGQFEGTSPSNTFKEIVLKSAS